MSPRACILTAGAPGGKPGWVVHRTPLALLSEEERQADRPQIGEQHPAAGLLPEAQALGQAGILHRPRYLHPRGLYTDLPARHRRRRMRRGLAGRLVLSLPWLPLRHDSSLVSRLGGRHQTRGAAAQVSEKDQGVARRGPGQRLIQLEKDLNDQETSCQIGRALPPYRDLPGPSLRISRPEELDLLQLSRLAGCHRHLFDSARQAGRVPNLGLRRVHHARRALPLRDSRSPLYRCIGRPSSSISMCSGHCYTARTASQANQSA